MLDADMNALFQNTTIDIFVHTNSNSGFGYVEDDSGSAVVELVWHTLMDGWVCEDIYVVTNFNRHKVLRKVDRSMLPVFLGKHVTGTSPDSV